MKKAIIIRYCEIHLKGKNRSYFEKMLVKNIKNSLNGLNFDFIEMHNRYLIENFDESELPIIETKLKKIAGIHNYSLSYVVENNYSQIEQTVLTILDGKKGTFKIETNRADKNFTPNSMEVSKLLGGSVLSKFPKELSVKVKNPDYTVYVDIREDGKTLIYLDTINCMSGMPVGSSGNGLLLISGGIDSPVAGYLMAKRGMKINCLHFHSFPYTGEAAKNKVEQLTSLLSEYNGGNINLNVVSFTKIQEEIHKKCPPEFMITMMRRFMMRIAEKFAKKNKLQAIITGESLGQVASQTIESITSSNSVVSMPVLRPLIALDKLEIIDIANKIGTYETSILPYEDCCTVFLPKYPAIKPDLNKVIASEQKLDVESLIEEALANIEVIEL